MDKDSLCLLVYCAMKYILFLLLATACAQQPDSSRTTQQAPAAPAPPRADTTLTIGGMAVTILAPTAPHRADLLLLPGWNYSRTDWCEKTDFCRQAQARGYRIILPEMYRTIYPERIYPETRADFKTNKTRPWIWDTLIATLANTLGVLVPDGPNVVMGLSTGAHGGSLLCLDRPEYFRAAVLLSGDYELPLLPHDRITQATYGAYTQFPDRWKGTDNPATRADKWATPLYLGHGTADVMIPPNQSQIFYDRIVASQPQMREKVVLNLAKGMAHDYIYWGSETIPALDFMDKTLGTTKQ